VDCTLRQGSVVTVEPGLYYPELGGCRIEDVVQVTPRAPRMLSRYHYEWNFDERSLLAAEKIPACASSSSAT
jgi:Xaa-Pro aminopeptidase